MNEKTNLGIARETIKYLAVEIEMNVKMSKSNLDVCTNYDEVDEKIVALCEIRNRIVKEKNDYWQCIDEFAPEGQKLEAWELINKRYSAILAFIDYRKAIVSDYGYNRFLRPIQIEREKKAPILFHSGGTGEQNHTKTALEKYNEAWIALGGEVNNA